MKMIIQKISLCAISFYLAILSACSSSAAVPDSPPQEAEIQASAPEDEVGFSNLDYSNPEFLKAYQTYRAILIDAQRKLAAFEAAGRTPNKEILGAIIIDLLGDDTPEFIIVSMTEWDEETDYYQYSADIWSFDGVTARTVYGMSNGSFDFQDEAALFMTKDGDLYSWVFSKSSYGEKFSLKKLKDKEGVVNYTEYQLNTDSRLQFGTHPHSVSNNRTGWWYNPGVIDGTARMDRDNYSEYSEAQAVEILENVLDKVDDVLIRFEGFQGASPNIRGLPDFSQIKPNLDLSKTYQDMLDWLDTQIGFPHALEETHQSLNADVNMPILEPIGMLFRDVEKLETALVRMSVGVYESSFFCIGDPTKEYAYILMVGQWHPPYDEDVVQTKDIRCRGIASSVGCIFPNAPEEFIPGDYFTGLDVSDYREEDGNEWFPGEVSFVYNDMSFYIYAARPYFESKIPAAVNRNDRIIVSGLTYPDDWIENSQVFHEYSIEKAHPEGAS